MRWGISAGSRLDVTPTESELEGVKESSGGKERNASVGGAGGASRRKGCGQPGKYSASSCVGWSILARECVNDLHASALRSPPSGGC